MTSMAHGILELTPRTALSPYDGFDKILVAGTWRHGRGDGMAEDLDPYTHEVLVRIPLADGRDVDEAYQAAAAAKREWSEWRPAERSAVLRRAAAVMEARREEIVDWLIRESGSTRIRANLEWVSPAR
jgi:aldehyde dehydrogenase (NAD+)